MVLISNWYRNALETVEKLEFYEKISPELTSLVKDGVLNEELFDLLTRRDEVFEQDVEDALLLKDIIYSQIYFLKERRENLTEKANRFVSKRLIEDVDRRQFADDVQELRRKVHLIDLNIQKCETLLQRLKNTSFGIVTDYIALHDEDESDRPFERIKKIPSEPQQRSRVHRFGGDQTVIEMLADLIEEKIIDDVKKQIIRKGVSQRNNSPYYRETRSRQASIDNDDDGEGT